MTEPTQTAKDTRGAAATLQTPVLELLQAWPVVRPVLIRAGLTGLAGHCYWPKPEVTLGHAAQRHGVDAATLLRAVNEEIAKQTENQS